MTCCVPAVGLCAKSTGVPTVGGLVGLAEEFCGIRSWKRQRVTMSDWASDRLDLSQIRYAAYDALAARMIFDAVTAAAATSESAAGGNTVESSSKVC